MADMLDDLNGAPAVGVNGVIGVDGAFMIRPPQPEQ